MMDDVDSCDLLVLAVESLGALCVGVCSQRRGANT